MERIGLTAEEKARANDSHRTYGEAMADSRSSLSMLAAKTAAAREEAVGEWMAKGYTREEAYRASLFGFRKA
jgi:hypothetical protein